MKLSVKTLSLILNVVLICVIIYLVRGQGDNEALIRSEERVKSLELERDGLIVANAELVNKQDSLEVELLKKPKERTIIKIKYDEKYKDLVSLGADESVSFLSRRLSEVNLD